MLERRNVAGDVAALSRVLDPDYLGAQVREHLGAERPGSELRDGQDAHALEGRSPSSHGPLTPALSPEARGRLSGTLAPVEGERAG